METCVPEREEKCSKKTPKNRKFMFIAYQGNEI
jgi:hypothetical protein